MEIKATSLEHAINLAVQAMQCDRKQIRILTLRQPLSLFWGLIKREGLYKVMKIEERKEEEPNEVKDGYVEIAQGRVKVTDPMGMGKYASIIVETTELEVYINGERVMGTSFVREDDWIEIENKNVSPSTDIEVEITRDKMQAVLKIMPKPGRNYFVKDTKRCNRIYIRAGYHEVPPPKTTFEECMKHLMAAKVMMELIDVEAVKKLAESPSGGSAIVAQGRQPIHGIDSQIEYLFNRYSYRNPKLDSDKKVDLLDHTIIPTVQAGEVLAIRTLPAIPGRDGTTVTGEVLKARQGKERPLSAGKGAIVLEDSKIVAAIDGRPFISGGAVSVMPVLVISRDVDVSTGNVSFDGDVIIKGNVVKGTKVTAGGHITVYGSVYDASLYGEGDIRVYGRIINGKVISGGDIIAYLIVLPKIKRMVWTLEDIYKRIKSMEIYGRQAMISEFVFSQFNEKGLLKDFIKNLEKLLPVLEDNSKMGLSSVLDTISHSLLGINAYRINSAQKLLKVIKDIREYSEVIELDNSRNANVVFNYSQSSVIQSNGDIICTGKGCFQTNMIAKNEIVFKKLNSIVRGGVLIAEKNITAGTLGSPMGISTYCRVLDKKGKITAACYYDNTYLNINGNLTAVKKVYTEQIV